MNLCKTDAPGKGSVLVNDFWTPPGPPTLLSNLYMTKLVFIKHYLGLGQVKTLSGPSAAARMGQGAERCGHMLGQLRHFLGRELRLGQARGPSAAATGQVKLRHFLSDPCTKLIAGGGAQGGSKNRSLGQTPAGPIGPKVLVLKPRFHTCIMYKNIFELIST